MGRKSHYTKEYLSEAVELAKREGPAKIAKELKKSHGIFAKDHLKNSKS
jgi:hypothetical protein